MLICPSWRQGNMTLNEVYKLRRRKGLYLFQHFNAFVVNIQLKLILQIDALQTKILLMLIPEMLTVRELVRKAKQD